MARYTAEEVQANRRPALIPGLYAASRSSIVVTEHVGPPGKIYSLRFPIKNGGTGPALDIQTATHREYPFESAGTVAAGDEVFLTFPTFKRPDDGETLEWLSLSIYLDYTDIAGAPFTTQLAFSFGDRPPASLTFSVRVVEGRATKPFVLPPMKPGDWRFRRAALRPRLRSARERLFLAPGEPMRPFRPRVAEAWREIFPPRRQSYLQRLGYARRALRVQSHMFEAHGSGPTRPLRRLRLQIAVMAAAFRKYR